MPRVPTGMLPPPEVWEFAGLTKASLGSLRDATLLDNLQRLTPTDAVIARAMKWLYWTGPSVNRPGSDPAIKAAALTAKAGLLDMLARLEHSAAITDTAELAKLPVFACVVLSTGKVLTARSAAGALDAMQQVTEPWLCLPIGQWKKEADERWGASAKATQPALELLLGGGA